MDLLSAGITSRAPSCRYSTREWEAQKTRIERLYVAEKRPLRDVKRVLQEESGFIVSEKQLKTRLTKWGLDTKNVKGIIMLEIARKQARRKIVDGKDSSFHVNEKPVEQQKIRRYLRRNKISEEALLSMASPCNVESPPFTVFTPVPVSPDPFPESLHSNSTAASEEAHVLSKLKPITDDWTTLIKSLASDTVEAAPDLFDALASMAATKIPDLVDSLGGLFPMTAVKLPEHEESLQVNSRRSLVIVIRCLQSLLQSILPGPKQEVQMEICIASALILAVSCSWYDRRQTEFKRHLAGAGALLHLALTSRRNSDAVRGSPRLKILCNAWIYLDTMSRLTCIEDNPPDRRNISLLMTDVFGLADNELDPLMGCSATLFLLIRKAVELYRTLRSGTSAYYNAEVISLAAVLQDIKQWKPPISLESTGYAAAQISDALETAESLRLAALITIQQCVRLESSYSSYRLAQQVIQHLSKIPMSSSSVFIHAFPLLVAGCEACRSEDREWIRVRWEDMSKRVKFRKLDDFWAVTQEVWRRRASFLISTRIGSSTELVLPEDLVVVGGFHWASVMGDWRWELLF